MVNGILNIYKEKGYTSHDVVAKLRGIVGQKKIGHTGTLDPDAEGVLPVCLGRATRLCDMLTDKEKTYQTTMLLGTVTDTQDISGKILEHRETTGITPEKAADYIQRYIGGYDQLPPMFSALKVHGNKLCDLARQGKTVERNRRRIQIFDIRILEIQLPRIRMEVRCSKGTYIRTLCHDIGQDLGCGACMEFLLRTRVGRFGLKDSITLAKVQALAGEGALGDVLVPVDEIFSDKKAVIVKEAYQEAAYNGNALLLKHMEPEAEFAEGEWVRVYDAQKHFIGIFAYDSRQKKLAVEKMFLDQEELGR